MRGSPMTTATWRGPPGQNQAGMGLCRAGQGGTALLGCGTGRCRFNKDWSLTTVSVPSLMSCEKISDAWGCFRSAVLPPGLPCNSSYPWQHVCDLQTLLLSLELLNAAFQQLRISSLSEGIKCSYQRISLVLSVLKAFSGSEHHHPCNWFYRVPKFFLSISRGYSWERKRLNLTHRRLQSRAFSDNFKTRKSDCLVLAQ